MEVALQLLSATVRAANVHSGFKPKAELLTPKLCSRYWCCQKNASYHKTSDKNQKAGECPSSKAFFVAMSGQLNLSDVVLETEISTFSCTTTSLNYINSRWRLHLVSLLTGTRAGPMHSPIDSSGTCTASVRCSRNRK